MRQHHALGSPGRAGRVEQHSDLIRAARRDGFRRRAAIHRRRQDGERSIQRQAGCAMARRVRPGLRRVAVSEEQCTRIAMRGDFVDLVRALACVEYHGPRVKLGRGEEQGQRLDAVLADDHDAVAGANAEPVQCAGRCAYRLPKACIGPAFAARLHERDGLGRARCRVRHKVADTVRQIFQSDSRNLRQHRLGFEAAIHSCLLIFLMPLGTTMPHAHYVARGTAIDGMVDLRFAD